MYVKTIKPSVTNSDIIRYKNYKKILDKLKRSAKILYYHTKCSKFKSNVKKLWDLINHVIGKASDKSSVISHIKVNEIEILNEKAIANKFGQYFSNVGKEFAGRVKDSKHKIAFYNDKIIRNSKSIYFHHTTKAEIKKLIKNLPNKTSSGYDNISNILLKKLCTTITLPLSLIFNVSFSNGVSPSKMKLSETTPLYKGKETYYTINY